MRPTTSFFQLRIRAVSLALSAALAVVATAQPAAAGPAEDCRAAQLKAAGKACRAIVKCYGKGATAGVVVDTDCTGVATGKLLGAFTKVEGKLSCAVEGRGEVIRDALLGSLELLASSDLGYQTGGKCASKKLTAAAKNCSALFKCYATAAKASTPFTPDPACLAAASGKFDEAFAKIDDGGECTTTGNAATVEARIDNLAAYVGCELSSENCDDNASCANTPGSLTCTCNSGYSGDGVTCTDINECATSNGGCDALTTCTNTPGSRTCGSCPAGYTGSGDTQCTDIDECTSDNNNCDASATCTNTAGSFTCCTPVTACPFGQECGTAADGCGGTISCGPCPSGELCSEDNHCGPPCASGADCKSDENCILGVCETLRVEFRCECRTDAKSFYPLYEKCGGGCPTDYDCYVLCEEDAIGTATNNGFVASCVTDEYCYECSPPKVPVPLSFGFDGNLCRLSPGF